MFLFIAEFAFREILDTLQVEYQIFHRKVLTKRINCNNEPTFDIFRLFPKFKLWKIKRLLHACRFV